LASILWNYFGEVRLIVATLRIPTPLRSYTDGQAEVKVSGGSIAAAMDDLIGRYPTLKPHLYNGDGQLRPFVNLFVGEDNIKDLQGLDTPLAEDARLILIPSIAGG
jgi:sulfur-carrier protein